jgi:hypothetical protein
MAKSLYKVSGWTVVSVGDLREDRAVTELYKEPRSVASVLISGMVKCSVCASSLGTLMVGKGGEEEGEAAVEEEGLVCFKAQAIYLFDLRDSTVFRLDKWKDMPIKIDTRSPATR